MATAPETSLALRDILDSVIDRIPRYESGRSDLLITTSTFKVVKTDDEKVLAGTYARDVQAEIKSRKSHYDPAVKALDELHARAVALRDGPINILRTEMNRLTTLTMNYDEEQRRQREMAARALEAEARRKQAEEQARINEAARIERERIMDAARVEREKSEAEALERARLLEADGKAKAAAAELERAAAAAQAESERAESAAQAVQEQADREIIEVQAEPIILPPMPEPTKVQGLSGRKDYEPIFGDIRLLVAAAAQNPDAYCQYLAFNEKAIGAAVRSQKEKFKCPGVTVKEILKNTVRGSKS